MDADRGPIETGPPESAGGTLEEADNRASAVSLKF